MLISRQLPCLLLSVFLVLLTGCGPTLRQARISDQAVQVEKEKQQEIAFDTFIKRQKRLYAVSFPLLAAAYSMDIADAILVGGFLVCTKDAFGKEYQEVAQRYFNLGDNPVIYYVQPQFPAANAGIKVGDRLLNYDGTSLTGKSYKEIKKILQQKQLGKDKRIKVVVERDGRIMDFTLEGVPCAKYNLVLVANDQINAMSDGQNIIIFSGMMRTAENDDELAFVVAHEIAHNVLGHVRKKRGNVILGSILDFLILGVTGVSTGGLFGQLGSAAHSKGFESEADYAGLYIAARAGYDVSGAVYFWRRLAAEHPRSTERGFGASHPSTPERFVAMEQTIREIEGKQRLGQPLIPESPKQRSSGKSGWHKPSEPAAATK